MTHTRRDLLATAAIALPGGAAAQPFVPGRLPRDVLEVAPAFPIPRDYPSAMHVAGNRLLRASGQPAVLRGACVPAVAWIAQRNDSQMGFFDNRMFNAASAWGCDILRLSVMPAVWRRAGRVTVLGILDAAVAYARHCGLYLSICWHGIGFPPEARSMTLNDRALGPLYAASEPEMRAFWRAIAQRYGDNPVVSHFELYNEPQFIQRDGRPALQHDRAMWLALRDWAEAMTDLIREDAPRKPICMGGLQFAYDLSFALRDPLRRTNILYATHPYPDANWRLSWQDAFLEPSRHFPVMITEFGWDHRDHPEARMRGGGAPYRQALMRAADAHGLGWQAWAFSHSFTPALLLNPRFAPAPDFGDFVRGQLLRHRA